MRFTPEDAVIPPEKLRDYVLSPSHPDGRAKAAYLARLGYSQEALATAASRPPAADPHA